ncbi:MAG: SurA N-terminal domain-containing protein [Solirubrobacterales bacterium]
MNRTKQIAVLSGALVALLLLAIGGVYLFGRDSSAAPGAAVRSTEPLDLGPVIATVDGAPIYLGEAKARIDGLTTMHGDLTAALGADWHEVVLGSLVSDQVQRAEAKARGIVVTDTDIQSSVADITDMLGEGQTLDDWLAAQEMSYSELVRRIELQLIGSRVYLAVSKDVTVSGQAIRDYYRENPTEFEGTDGHISPLLEVRKSIRDSLMKTEQEQAYSAWLEKAKSDADVVIVMKDWWKDLG